MRRARNVRPLAAALIPVTAKSFKARGFADANIVKEWPAIVGAELAACSVPERLRRDGALRVRTSGPVALELQHMAPQIIERIATYYGYRAVKRLIYVQGPLPRPPAPKPRPRRVLDRASARAVEGAVAPTGDEGLRNALKALGQALHTRPVEDQPVDPKGGSR